MTWLGYSIERRGQMDKLKDWLEQNGFDIKPDNINTDSWVAHKRVWKTWGYPPHQPPCMTVKPHVFADGKVSTEYGDVILAEYVNSLWCEIAFKGMQPGAIRQHYQWIETRLVNAWEALGD